MLAFGLQYAARFARTPHGVRGLKYMALANAVSLGFPRGGERLDNATKTDRVRGVQRGHLRPLWEALTEDARELQRAEAEAAAKLTPQPTPAPQPVRPSEQGCRRELGERHQRDAGDAEQATGRGEEADAGDDRVEPGMKARHLARHAVEVGVVLGDVPCDAERL